MLYPLILLALLVIAPQAQGYAFHNVRSMSYTREQLTSLEQNIYKLNVTLILYMVRMFMLLISHLRNMIKQFSCCYDQSTNIRR
jgi:hypothetical protein